ncbi:MAG: DNA-binding IclR family transcriptional regulator [Urechidicola sp.]|jgi:DNA-binding IclR family transcriptional regulator
MTKDSKTYRIQSIDRATELLDAIARYPEPVSLKILSAETGLHSSTTFRILAALIQNHLVEKDPSGNYKLGLKLLQLGARLHSKIDLGTLASPVLEFLCQQLNESANLTIREGDEVVYIQKATPKRMMHVQQMIGSRAPLHVTAVGKLILGHSGADAIEGYAQRTNLPAYTRNTINNVNRLQTECTTAVEQGYALDNEEAEIDVGCIGVLIFDNTNVAIAGLSVSAPIERRRESWIAIVMEAGRQLSEQLGYVKSG